MNLNVSENSRSNTYVYKSFAMFVDVCTVAVIVFEGHVAQQSNQELKPVGLVLLKAQILFQIPN